MQLHGGIFLLKCFEEGVKKFIGVVNSFGVLADDPNHGCLSEWFVKGVEIVAEGGDDGFVSIGVTTEDVLDDNDRLLNDIIYLCLNEFEENTYTLVEKNVKNSEGGGNGYKCEFNERWELLFLFLGFETDGCVPSISFRGPWFYLQVTQDNKI